MDPTALLEQRIEALIKRIAELRGEAEQTRKRTAELEQKASDFKRVQETNSKMMTEIRRLEANQRDADARETQIRERLEGILKKIDALEEVISDAPSLPSTH